MNRLSEFGIAYPSSTIVEGPGRRYLDESMRGGSGIRSRFLVMTNDTNQQMDQLSSKFGEVIDLRKARDPGMTLVRPDGYVAYASHRTGDPDSMRAIETMLHKQAR